MASPVDSRPEAGELTEVAPGVFAWVQPDGSWYVNNAGAVRGDDGVIVVDTCATERRTRRFLAAVDRATDGAPIRLAVNTHLHGDHTYGNSVLPGSTVLVGHEAMREGLLADPLFGSELPFLDPPPDWGNVRRRVPDVVLRDGLILYAGKRRVELSHPGGPAHTDGDVVAWVPDERVLFTGDLVFHRITPLVLMGSLAGALRSLDWIDAFQPRHVVPGHGDLLDAAALPAVLAAHERYYRFVLDTARAARAEGLTPLQAAEGCELGEFAAWPDHERIVLNLHRAYAEAEGRDIALSSAIADVVAFHGGPMRCIA